MSFKKLIFKSLVAFVIFLLTAAIIYFLLPPELQRPFLNIIGLIIIAVGYLVIIVDLVFLLPTIKGAIFLPTSDKKLADMLKLANIKVGEKAIDIGSGDGRVVAALAKEGAIAYGCEINPLLVWWSKLKHSTQVPPDHFRWLSMWDMHYSEYQVVTLFGMTYIMGDLETKLLQDLKPGARVICNSFPFPNWQPAKKRGSAYLYIKE